MATNQTAKPSHVMRQQLRDKIRRLGATETGAVILSGRDVSRMTMQELWATLREMEATGLDTRNPDVAGPTSADRRPDLGDDQGDLGDDLDNDDQGAPDPITAEVQTLRDTIMRAVMQGGVATLDDQLTTLVREARKPAVTVIERVEVPVAAPVDPSASTTRATRAPTAPAKPAPVTSRQTGATETWRKLFKVRGALGTRTCHVWDGAHPDTPPVNTIYAFPQPQTALVLTTMARGQNAYLYGPPGTGKTEFALQLAARLGRPAAVISCDAGTDAATLAGMTVPSPDGGVSWQDGALTKAIRTPGCVVLLDEPSLARPGALFVMQNVLANRTLYIAETGERVKAAPGVVFLAADNTNGTGGGARRGLTDTNRLNAAFLDRFSGMVRFEYADEATEVGLIVDYTGCTPQLAELLVKAASNTRAAAEAQQMTAGIGLRRLIAWAGFLSDGHDIETAFATAVLNHAPENDREAMRQQCLLAYDKANVNAALNPTAPGATVTPQGAAAAADFPAFDPNTDTN